MGKYKALMTLGAIAALIAIASLLKNKNMKNYIFTGLVALLIGGVVGYFLHKPETKIIPGKTVTVYKDTCDYDRIIADVITESNTVEIGGVKPGKKQKDSSDLSIVETSKKDSTYTTVFEKSYNTGLMRMKVKTTVKAKSVATGKIEMEYELDTVTLKEMTTIVNTVVINKDSTDIAPTEVVKYLPVESTKYSGAFLGLSGGMLYTDKINYQAGINLSGERLGLTLYTTPKDLKQFGIQLNTKLVKLSKNK